MKTAKLTMLKIDELSAVDRPCQAPATVALMKRATSAPAQRSAPVNKAQPKCAGCSAYMADGATSCPSCGMGPAAKRALVTVSKSVMLTTATMGHCHLLDDGGGSVAQGGDVAGYTTSESMPALPGQDTYATYHSHPWSRATDGTIVIGEALGHVHQLLTADKLDAAIAVVESTDTGVANKRAPQEITMADKPATVTEVAKVAPTEVYKSLDGSIYTTADDARLVKMAQDRDEDRKLIAKRDAELQTERLEKRASVEMPNLPKTNVEKVALLRAVDGIADEIVRKSVTEMLHAANGALVVLGKTIGHGALTPNGTVGASAETDVIKVKVTAFQKARNLPTYEQAYLLALSEDQEIRDLYNASQVVAEA